jgi:hypothetical protein
MSDPGRRKRVLLVNTSPTGAVSVANRWFAPGSDLETLTYSASTAGAADPIVRSTVTAGRTLSLPAESIAVLRGG